MAQDGLHHLHLRERLEHKHLEPYPHPVPWKRRLDRFMYVVGAATPIALLPQFLEVWVGRNTEGVSVITWFALCLVNVAWLTYGFVHGAKVIIFSNSLLLVLNFLVALGALVLA